MPTTAIAAIAITAIAVMIGYCAWRRPVRGSTAEMVAISLVALCTALIMQNAWGEIAAVTLAIWVLTVGVMKRRETIAWTVAAWSGTAVVVWMAQNA